jgi:hypothetical protein
MEMESNELVSIFSRAIKSSDQERAIEIGFKMYQLRNFID